MLNSDSCICMTEENIFFDYLSYFTGRRSVNIYHVTGVYSVSKYLYRLFCSCEDNCYFNRIKTPFFLVMNTNSGFYKTTQINFCSHYSKNIEMNKQNPHDFWILPFYYHLTMKYTIIGKICSNIAICFIFIFLLSRFFIWDSNQIINISNLTKQMILLFHLLWLKYIKP